MEPHGDVVIKRESLKPRSPKKGKPAGSDKKSEQPSAKKEYSPDYKRNIRILAVAMAFLAIFTLLSLISYSARDYASAHLSPGEIIGLISGDPEVKAKVANTNNWLGIAGAFFSDFLYNGTIGFAILIFPAFLGLWAKNLFQRLFIPEKLIRRTLAAFLLGSLLASTIAAFAGLSWAPDIPMEWHGAIGSLAADIISSLVGSLGAFLLFAALSAIVVLRLTNFDVESFAQKAGRAAKNIGKSIFGDKENISSYFEKVKGRFKKKNNTIWEKPGISNEKIEEKEFSDSEKSGEPARIIKNNLNIQINNPTNGANPILKQKPGDENSLVDKLIAGEYPGEKPEEESKSKEKNKASAEKNSIENEIESSPLAPKPSSMTERGKIEYPENSKNTEVTKDNENQAEPEAPAYFDAGDFFKSLEHHSPETEQPAPESSDEIRTDDEPAAEQNAETPEKDEECVSGSSKKPLTVTVKENDSFDEADFKPEPVNLLGTSIHDEKIDFKFPDIDFLEKEEARSKINDDELKMNARLLQEKLETFKIFIENLEVTPGPVVTQYEFVPAPGIKVSKIENLDDDIAMALKAKGIRIIAPIPGKGTVGIEIPNSTRNTVRFRSIITSKNFINGKQKLPLAFGKTISGDVFVSDLAKMPHLLIAGSTGAGKSVGINTIISSLIYRKHPSQLKFAIIDPKKVELRQYEKLARHYLAKSPDIDELIITEPENAVVLLKSLCAEMDKRYDILASAGQRNIEDYNAKVRAGKLDNDDEIIHKEMPYIVVLIDELADLMLTASKEVETPLIRLAQLARAIGIHLVVATQRPSVNVITGIIKANFPARIAYLVASKVDSRTILDTGGAEQLLGQGDMLFLPNGSPKPIRLQNAFISTDEVENICEFVENQKGYSEPYMLPSLIEEGPDSDGISKGDRDPLFEDAAKLIIHHQQGSVSLIQRRLKVGYARAGRIVDELEAAGVVGPHDGSKARKVYMESEMELEAVL